MCALMSLRTFNLCFHSVVIDTVTVATAATVPAVILILLIIVSLFIATIILVVRKIAARKGWYTVM